MGAQQFVVAVAGATGAVGREMLKILEERDFPASKVIALASSRSAGSTVPFKNTELLVEELTEASFQGVDIALFSAGGSTSEKFAPYAAAAGCVVVDNSSAWRMDDRCPLVVPEVNPDDLDWHNGIIANPNCSTIQMVVALKPLHDAATITRVVVSTYQAVSGTGQKAIEELERQVRGLMGGQEVENKVYPHRIAFNVLPQIDVFLENEYTKEEMKMVHETKKIMGDDSIRVTATAVRVPVFFGHSESVNIETAKKLTAKEARAVLAQAPGVRVLDNPGEKIYPMPINAGGMDDTYVGRIREDDTIENGLNLWVVADNLRKGAALNAVQIAETLAARGLVRVQDRNVFETK
ncbi:aspartate-semialdehyde dehydrogenase [Megalodesulfovibrio gigas]|uniref:Aspartate-semialdehyde dehydrogenase n=1 Tax=Megalodesulfovibrio gigas (strain ATCC 19364 / DSM 1382 / NCIMB 9332 / VKM B-1759) TaxID=1121448 RepID=T2G821_MEGG1|nr:aspartate-semialdehyde dehydrogenase [Megalodesulfovibrio gigas]AGW12329.1 putative aspartate-semialdehyde dehydrogenase [Megalodesulfovibrio gigas DSM 1382 = ATCC 19364]